MAWQQVIIKLNHLSNNPKPSKINHQFHVQLKYHIFLFSQQSFGHILANPERICMHSVGRESTRCIVFSKHFQISNISENFRMLIFFSFHFFPPRILDPPCHSNSKVILVSSKICVLQGHRFDCNSGRRLL